MKNLSAIGIFLSQLVLFCWASSAGLADDVGSASGRYSSYRGEFPAAHSPGASGGSGEEHDESNVPAARKANFEPAFTPPSDAPQTTSIEITSRNNAGGSDSPSSYNNAASNVQQYDNGDGQEARVAFPAGFPFGDADDNGKKGGYSGESAGPNLQTVQHYVPGKGYTAVKVNKYESKPDSYDHSEKQEPAHYYPSANYAAQQQQSGDTEQGTSIRITTNKQQNYDAGYSAPQNKDDYDGAYKPGKDDKPDPNALVYVPGKGYTKGLNYFNEYGPWSPGYGLQPNPNDKDDGKPPPGSEADPFYNSPPASAQPERAYSSGGAYKGDDNGQYKGEDNGQYKPERPKKQQLSIYIKPAASYVGGYGGDEQQQQHAPLKPKANYEPAFTPPSGASQYSDYSGGGANKDRGGSPAAYGGSRNDYARRNNDDEDGATASYSPFYNGKYDKQEAAYGSKPYPPPKYGPGSDENGKDGEGETPVINKRK